MLHYLESGTEKCRGSSPLSAIIFMKIRNILYCSECCYKEVEENFDSDNSENYYFLKCKKTGTIVQYYSNKEEKIKIPTWCLFDKHLRIKLVNKKMKHICKRPSGGIW